MNIFTNVKVTTKFGSEQTNTFTNKEIELHFIEFSPILFLTSNMVHGHFPFHTPRCSPYIRNSFFLYSHCWFDSKSKSYDDLRTSLCLHRSSWVTNDNLGEGCSTNSVDPTWLWWRNDSVRLAPSMTLSLKSDQKTRPALKHRRDHPLRPYMHWRSNEVTHWLRIIKKNLNIPGLKLFKYAACVTIPEDLLYGIVPLKVASLFLSGNPPSPQLHVVHELFWRTKL